MIPRPHVIARTIGLDSDNGVALVWSNWQLPVAANDEQEDKENNDDLTLPDN